MKTLVTGSSGHLGTAIMRTLNQQKIQAVGVDILPSAFTHLVGSISEMAFVKTALEDVSTIIHTATLHKPHVVTHSRQDFVDTNITGTLNLLEAAVINNVKAFVYTSTTSAFGDALVPAPGAASTWITEEVNPIPKNIYGVTKLAAENLCRLFYRNYGLACIVLRTSRFFLEEDDQESIRIDYADENVKANEFLYRRADMEDIVAAHLLATEKAASIGFGNYIISATTPFTQNDLPALNGNAAAVVKKLFPAYESIYRERNWKMFPVIDRVYVNDAARRALHWQPKYDFGHVLQCLERGDDFFSPLHRQTGTRGYHGVSFQHGPYPV